MIKLFQLPPAWGLANISMPSMKLETWLRIAGLPYEAAPPAQPPPPKGKVPYIEDAGTVLGDSTLIIEHLKTRYGKDPDAALSPAEGAVALAFRRMLKEHFYWIIVHFRWRNESNWPVYRALLASILAPGVPAEALHPALEETRKAILAQLHGHGMGRHGESEVSALGCADVDAIANYLGDKPYFMGAQPTTADATVYAFMANLVDVPVESGVKARALGYPNIINYCARMKERYYPR